MLAAKFRETCTKIAKAGHCYSSLERLYVLGMSKATIRTLFANMSNTQVKLFASKTMKKAHFRVKVLTSTLAGLLAW